MNILITGGDGQLAKSFSELLRNQNLEFNLLSKKEFDITNYDFMKEFFKTNQYDLVINCAAYNLVDDSEEFPNLAFKVNSYGPKFLSILSNKYNFDLVHFSSDYVFDGKKGSPYRIYDTPNPLSIYGQSKLYGEKFLMAHTLKYYLIRTSWVFGNGSQNFISKLIKWSNNSKILKISNDEVSSPTYSYNLAETTLKLISNNLYGIYHITSANSCSRFEWAKYILEKINWDGELSPVSKSEFKTKAVRPNYSVLDPLGIEIVENTLPNWEESTDNHLKKLDLIK